MNFLFFSSMPTISKIFVYTATFYLSVGSFLAFFISLGKSGFYPQFYSFSLIRIHMNIMLFGWVTLFVFGVAFWIFPRLGGKRGGENMFILIFVLINFGIFLSFFDAVYPYVLFLFSACLFVFGISRRVYPPPFGGI